MDAPKPKVRKPENLVVYYVYLAVACAGLGMGITVLLILFCEFYGIDLLQNLWLLAVPATVSLFVNVLFVELYRRLRNR